MTTTEKNSLSGQLDEEDEETPVEFWEKKQRELVLSQLDYNLATLIDLIGKDKIDLSPRYQRRHRWDAKRQSLLIESFLMNVPVPPIFLNEDNIGKYSVIDGKQRLLTIRKFLTNNLELTGLQVFSDINGKTFKELPVELQDHISTRTNLRAIVILRQSDEDIKFVVFQRLNTGGVNLNAQEIRNSTYPGPLNNLILKLSEHRLYHRLLGIKQKGKSSIYQEMRDVELVLRYFTFKDNWEKYSGSIKRTMDRYMSRNQYLEAKEVDLLRMEFVDTLEKIEIVLGGSAFRRWIPEKNQWRAYVVAAIYDAEMFSFREFSKEDLEKYKTKIVVNLKRLFGDDDFVKSIQAATNTPSYFKYRIAAVRTAIKKAIGGV